MLCSEASVLKWWFWANVPSLERSRRARGLPASGLLSDRWKTNTTRNAVGRLLLHCEFSAEWKAQSRRTKGIAFPVSATATATSVAVSLVVHWIQTAGDALSQGERFEWPLRDTTPVALSVHR